MKMSALLFLALFFTSLASAEPDTALGRSNGMLRFIAQNAGLRNLALSTAIGNRCARYMAYHEDAPCKATVNKMIALLDYDIILSETAGPDQGWRPDSFVFVAFKTNFLYLLSSPRTTTYLDDLNQKLYKNLVDEGELINIWDLTKAHYKTDYLSALVIAALFQDTSKMKLHLGYLEKAQIPGNKHFSENKELLSRVIDTINLLMDSSEDHFRVLFYPKEIAKNVNRNIYHFYVPLFLSMSLKKQGIHEFYAYSAPLMLTLTYEFITATSDYSNLFADPVRIDPDTRLGLWKLKDIFGGYCGANFGVRGMRFRKDFELIKESFARSTEDGVSILLRQ